MKKNMFIAGLIGVSILATSMPASAFAQTERSDRQRWDNRQSGANRAERVQRRDFPRQAPQRANRAQPQQTERIRPSANQARPENRTNWQNGRNDNRGQNWNNRDRQQPRWDDSIKQRDRQNRERWEPENRNNNQQRWNNQQQQREWNERQRREWNDRQRREQERNRHFNNGRYDNRHIVNGRPSYNRPNYNWNQNWRNDRRYDWQRYRDVNRNRYRYAYHAPRGWNYGYSRFSIGVSIWSGLFARNYWISDPYRYRLPPAYGTMRWIRYYDDVLLVDTRNGYVVDVIHNFFW